MQEFIPIIIDVAVIALAALMIWLQARRGFLRTVIELVGYILAAVVAFSAASYIANEVYRNNIRESVVESVGMTVREQGGIVDKSKIDELWDSLPQIVKMAAVGGGIDKDSISDELDKAVESGSGKIGEFLADDLIKPIVTSAISFVIAMILLALLMILVRFIAVKINNLGKLPIVGTANALLGGALGFIKGCLLIYLIIILISMLMPLFSNKMWIFTPQTIDKTHLFRILYTLSPFAQF